MVKFRNYFISGLVAILPIALSLWILGYLFKLLDTVVGKPIMNLIGFSIPGLGLLLSVLFILLLGMVVSNVVGKRIAKWVDGVLERIPVLKMVYSPIKDIMNNFTNEKSNNFKQAVLIEYPRPGLNSVGFITRENVIIDGVAMTIIFIPTTPNPTSGFIIYAKAADYQLLDVPVEVALRTIISLGTLTPQQIDLKVEGK